MELSDLKPTERVIDILHPATAEDTHIKVTLVSFDDERLKRVRRKFQDERMRLESKGKSFKSEDIEENALLLLYTAMTGWTWGADAVWRGQKPEFNLKNVKEVLTELPWFRSQIEEAMQDEAAFFSA